MVSPRKTSSDSSRRRPLDASLSWASVASGVVVVWIEVAIAFCVRSAPYIRDRSDRPAQTAYLRIAGHLRDSLNVILDLKRLKVNNRGSMYQGFRDGAWQVCLMPTKNWGCRFADPAVPFMAKYRLGRDCCCSLFTCKTWNVKSRAPKPGVWLMRGAQPATSAGTRLLPEARFRHSPSPRKE